MTLLPLRWSQVSPQSSALRSAEKSRGWVTLAAENRRQEFARGVEAGKQRADEERSRLITQGVARAESSRLGNISSVLSTALSHGSWWPSVITLDPALPLDDRKLLATALTDDEWDAVDVAEFSIAVMAAESEFAQQSGEDDLSGQSRESIEQSLAQVEAARKALLRLAVAKG